MPDPFRIRPDIRAQNGTDEVIAALAARQHGVVARSQLEVTAPRPRQRPGIRIHCAPLPADEITGIRGIPITTVARTLFDLASVLRQSQLERAINEAEVRRLAGVLSLRDLLDRYPRRRGTRMLKAVLKDARGVTHSELEARFSSWARAVGLPLPERNAYVLARGQWFECDCIWRPQRLIVELDGRRFHATAVAFERDRARDRALSAAGSRVIRVTWSQLRHERDSLAADLRALLSATGR
jgi:hypothetical protein